jgi:hypothetical protein
LGKKKPRLGGVFCGAVDRLLGTGPYDLDLDAAVRLIALDVLREGLEVLLNALLDQLRRTLALGVDPVGLDALAH